MLTYLYTAILLLLISFVQQSYALHCFVCNSARDPRCGDPFDDKTIEKADCNQLHPEFNATLCRKNIQKVNLGARSDVRVVRSCGHVANKLFEGDEPDADTSTRCFTRAGTFEVMVTYCSCSTEACNSAERGVEAKASATFLMLVLVPVVNRVLNW